MKKGKTPTDTFEVDKTVIFAACTDTFFPKVKFVNRDLELDWSNDPNTFCQHFIRECNVPEDINQQEWWMKARKHVMTLMSQTRNDRSTATRFAFLGE